MLSNKIEECLKLVTNDFCKYIKPSYSDVKESSEAILNLTKALSYQLQIEEKYKFESEAK